MSLTVEWTSSSYLSNQLLYINGEPKLELDSNDSWLEGYPTSSFLKDESGKCWGSIDWRMRSITVGERMFFTNSIKRRKGGIRLNT